MWDDTSATADIMAWYRWTQSQKVKAKNKDAQYKSHYSEGTLHSGAAACRVFCKVSDILTNIPKGGVSTQDLRSLAYFMEVMKAGVAVVYHLKLDSEQLNRSVQLFFHSMQRFGNQFCACAHHHLPKKKIIKANVKSNNPY